MGSPSRMMPIPIKAPGGSRGTPGVNTIPRAMQIREKPNTPESPDSRPGLLEIISTRQTRRAVEAPAGLLTLRRFVDVGGGVAAGAVVGVEPRKHIRPVGVHLHIDEGGTDRQILRVQPGILDRKLPHQPAG